jgi:hypothetical protein
VASVVKLPEREEVLDFLLARLGADVLDVDCAGGRHNGGDGGCEFLGGRFSKLTM